MYETINNNLLVKVDSNTEELMNGLKVESSVASRRKIVKGIVESKGENEGDLVYFPLYAADEISLEGENYFVVSKEDVKVLIKKDGLR